MFFILSFGRKGHRKTPACRNQVTSSPAFPLRNQEDQGKPATLRVKVRSGGWETHKQFTSPVNLKEIIAKKKEKKEKKILLLS